MAGTTDKTAPDILPDQAEHDDDWLRRLRESIATWAGAGPIFLKSPTRSEVWRLRLSGDGRLEVGLTPRTSPRKFVTVMDIDESGNVRIGGVLTEHHAFADPGR